TESHQQHFRRGLGRAAGNGLSLPPSRFPECPGVQWLGESGPWLAARPPRGGKPRRQPAGAVIPVSQAAFLGRVRLRLPVGGRLGAGRAAVLSQADGGDSLLAGTGPAPAVALRRQSAT